MHPLLDREARPRVADWRRREGAPELCHRGGSVGRARGHRDDAKQRQGGLARCGAAHQETGLSRSRGAPLRANAPADGDCPNLGSARQRMSAEDGHRERPLLVERDGAVETLVINDAPRNRMSLEFMDALEAEVERLAHDSSVRAVVIRGAGEENFSVGMDLKQLPQGIARMGSPGALFDQRLEILERDRESRRSPSSPFSTAIASEAGSSCPLACHFRLAAAEGARIGLPELDLGTVPAWGGSARLTRCVGRNHALDMILRAKKISGPEALRIGLVNEVWPIDELFRARAGSCARAGRHARARRRRDASLHRRSRREIPCRVHRRGTARRALDDGHTRPTGRDPGVPREEKATLQSRVRVAGMGDST